MVLFVIDAVRAHVVDMIIDALDMLAVQSLEHLVALLAPHTPVAVNFHFLPHRIFLSSSSINLSSLWRSVSLHKRAVFVCSGSGRRGECWRNEEHDLDELEVERVGMLQMRM